MNQVKKIVPDNESIVLSEAGVTESYWVGMVHNNNIYLLVRCDGEWAFCGRYNPPMYSCEFRPNAIKAALRDHRALYASLSLQTLVAYLIP